MLTESHFLTTQYLLADLRCGICQSQLVQQAKTEPNEPPTKQFPKQVKGKKEAGGEAECLHSGCPRLFQINYSIVYLLFLTPHSLLSPYRITSQIVLTLCLGASPTLCLEDGMFLFHL